jgi:drug/metabolite transporter (DMT)-like permease
MDLILAFFAAIVFALAALVFKRAYAEGAGIAHAFVINNLILGTVFLPMMWLDPSPIPWSLWYMPVLTGLSFLIGHLLNVVSIKAGDVSVVTPLLGAKVVFVGLLGWALFGVELTSTQWVASALATGGVLVLGRSGHGRSLHATRSIFLALSCAGAFAMTDVLIQAWGKQFGVFHFLPLQFAALGLLSSLTLPYFGIRSLKAPTKVWRWIVLAACLTALQGILVTTAIAIWKDASGVNVVYATRGLWTIAFIWVVGHWFKNTERQTAGSRIMAMRLAGALMILSAVVLTSVHSR